MSANVLNLFLIHQEPDVCRRLINRASIIAGRSNLLIAYGGSLNEFEKFDYEPKLFIEDPRLHTRDHQREIQSYTEIFRSAAKWMRDRSFEFVHFFEYDHLPLVADLNAKQIECLRRENTDVLGYHLIRVDDTSHPHFLQHAAFPKFAPFLHSISRRANPNVVLSMLVTGSFWTREAFISVAELQEPCPVYMELYLPTVAHHLGFRVRDFGDQNRFVSPHGNRSNQIDEARRHDAWTLHPVKDI
jgi:hypothetical protein